MRDYPDKKGNKNSVQIVVPSYKDSYESADVLVVSILETKEGWVMTQVALISRVQEKNTLRL